MWPNPQETADLVTFTEETLMENFIFLYWIGKRFVLHICRVPAYASAFTLTLSWQRLLSYRNQSIDLPSKSMYWFLYDRDLCHGRVRDAFKNSFLILVDIFHFFFAKEKPCFMTKNSLSTFFIWTDTHIKNTHRIFLPEHNLVLILDSFLVHFIIYIRRTCLIVFIFHFLV